MSFQKKPWRKVWTGSVSNSGYQYEKPEKVEREDPELYEILQRVHGSSAERDGYRYWYNETGTYGANVARKQTGGIPSERPNQGEQKTFQGMNYKVNQPQQQSQAPTPLTDIEASLQALHLKIDKLLEVHTVTNKVEFRNANAMKDDHGNEVSGSDAASSGIDIQQGIMNDEQTDEEGEREVESH